MEFFVNAPGLKYNEVKKLGHERNQLAFNDPSCDKRVRVPKPYCSEDCTSEGYCGNMGKWLRSWLSWKCMCPNLASCERLTQVYA